MSSTWTLTFRFAIILPWVQLLKNDSKELEEDIQSLQDDLGFWDDMIYGMADMDVNATIKEPNEVWAAHLVINDLHNCVNEFFESDLIWACWQPHINCIAKVWT